jgi:predicted O-methyltransferase YrrM
MRVNRRASLPGVDALFGAGPGTREQGQTAPEATPGPGNTAVVEAVAALRQVAANEDATLRSVRAAASELETPSPEIGALLRWAATACRARTVVEIGSAGGVSGLWLLEGMAEGGVLTSLEPDPAAHRLTAKAFEGIAAGPRVRSIHGDAATLLERLADASYDLVLLQTDRGHYPEHLARARDLLRPGGMLIARGILPTGEHQEALTRFVHDLVEDPGFSATVLPIDDGVALANRLSASEPG